MRFTLVVSGQFLKEQCVHQSRCFQESPPGWLAKGFCVIVLTYPLQQCTIPTASVVIGVILSYTGNSGSFKSKKPSNRIPLGTEGVTLNNQPIPVFFLCIKVDYKKYYL